MAIALFVESEAGELDNLPATSQTLLFGYMGEAHIYHRVSNGSKGRGQVWQRLTDTSLLPNTIADNSPVGVVLTERDLSMVGLGQITNIAVKCLYANESAELSSAPMAHRDVVNNLIVRLNDGDSTLADYVTDKRRVNDVSINPIGVAQKNADMGREAEKAEMVIDVMANPIEDMSLSMVSVPNPKWGKEYINRKIDGVVEWDIYDHALANGINVLVEGGAGSGKTMSVQGYASARGYRYFNISSNNGVEPSQLFGRWIPTAEGNYKWQDGAVTLLVRHGGVLLINEVNFLPVRVSTVLFSLLDYRREIQLLDNGGEVIKAHPNLLIVADMNAGYRGTQELNQAFADRFGIKLEFGYDRAIENKVIPNKALLTLADQLREQYDKEEISTPISTRALVSLLANAKQFGVDFAITSFVNSFNKDERGGVRLACETHKFNIASELGVKVSHAPISEVEEYTREVLV